MVNVSGRGLRAPEFQSSTRGVSSGVPRVNFSQVGVVSPASAQSADALTGLLQNISGAVKERIDVQDQIQGAKDGRAAGRNGVPQLMDEMTVKGRAFNKAAKDSAHAEFDMRARLRIDELEKEYLNDAVNFQEKSSAFIRGHVAGLYENGLDDVAQDIENKFILNQRNAVNRIEGRRKAIARDQHLQTVLQYQEVAQNDLIKVSRKLFDASPEEMPQILAEMTSVSASASDVAGQIDEDGRSILTPHQQQAFNGKLQSVIAEQVGLSWLEKQDDIDVGLAAWSKGEAYFEAVDDNGEIRKVKFEDVLGLDDAQAALPYMERTLRSKISQQNAVLEKQNAIVNSNFDLAIETAAGYEDLEKLSSQIDLYEDQIGVVKANAHRKKIFKAQTKFREENDDISMGARFARGDEILNPNDAKANKAFNRFYKEVQDELSAFEPAQRQQAIVQIVENAGVVPDLLKGEVLRAARSQDLGTIQDAANLIDRMSSTSPHLLRQLGSEKDMARIHMVNKRIDAGYEPSEAVELVDRQLDPRKLDEQERVSEEMRAVVKKDKIDFRTKATEAFAQFGEGVFDFLPGVDQSLQTGDVTAQAQIDIASAQYRMAWEDAYALSRDVDVADRMAKDKLRGQFGRTDINGKTQIMQFPPDKYYSLPGLSVGENAAWMRDQMIDDALAATENWLSRPSRKELKAGLRLLPVPSVTARTAEMGRPVYQLVYIKDGVPRSLMSNNQYYQFDPDRMRTTLIEEARENNGSFLNIFSGRGAK